MVDLKQAGSADEPVIRETPSDAPGSADKEANLAEPAPAVRFRSTVEEISPEETTTAPTQSAAGAAKGQWPQDLGAVTADELRALSQKLQGTNLQERRMSIFQFEPYSLPVSRAPSNDDSREPSRQPTRSSGSGHPSPSLQPRNVDLVSPPLTPAGTGHADADGRRSSRPSSTALSPRPDVITPQESTKDDTTRDSGGRKLVHRPASADDVPRRTKSGENRGQSVTSDHRRGLFTGGAAGSGSLPSSRDSSPSRVAASQHYSRGFTPPGEANDPYAASKRQPQAQGKIEPRFVFSRKNKGVSPSSSTVSLPKSVGHHDKRHSAVFNHRKEELMQQDNGSSSSIHGRQGSMSDLKRFFKLGGHHKVKRTASPAPSVKSTKSGYRTPPSQRSSVQMPFGDDHGLSSKYGKLGKVLGAGAGGSVRLMKRSEDNTVFAVKEFRPRHSYESEREYVKKLTAEYCMGSSLHHGNIIETLDIVQEKGKWYEVMEYAPYDLFAIVMTGKMSREEVSCCFLQILSGVTYLHSMGLAHRDLKLDNVVVSDRGIMKIIDFGSAHVYKYPFENGIVKASGIVGSDPYLAPEVYDDKKYDPTAVDIWSLAIIFCCMTLRRFPWKVPRLTDNSFKLFAAEPTPGHDPKKLTSATHRSASTTALANTPARDMVPEEADGDKDKPVSPTTTAPDATPISAPPEKKEVIRGPWRILRLLPRESRHVIGRMLEIKPRDRATMAEILNDPWVADTVICRQTAPGEVEPADDHTHILEPPAPGK